MKKSNESGVYVLKNWKKKEQRKTRVYVKKNWGRWASGRLAKQAPANVLWFRKVVLRRLLSQPLLEGNNLLLWG